MGFFGAVASVLDPYRVLREDDFLNSSTESGEIGDFGWVVVGTSTAGAQGTGVASHPGSMTIASGAATGNLSAFQLGSGQVVPSDIARMIAIVQIPTTITAAKMRVGFMQSPSSADGGTAGIYIEYDSVLSANWVAVTRNASTETRTDTTVPVVLDNWFRLNMQQVGANWTFSVNASAPVTNTTNIPTTGAGGLGIVSETTENVTKLFGVDYFGYRTISLGTRYT